MMKYDEFVALVKQMRDAQRTYFRERNSIQSRQWLSLAKELERRVDAQIKQHEDRQKSLFDDV